MKTHYYNLLTALILYLGNFPLFVSADAPVEDGVYYITNLSTDGYLGLGAYHNVDPYIYYVTDGQERTADAYWIVTNTRSGYTFRNEASGELLVYTEGRVDQYYKYMTLAAESPGDRSEYWNIIEGGDGACSIQSVVSTDHYWNLRSGTYMMGTYRGSNGNSWNERYVFHKKEATPDPVPDVTAETSFPDALHVFLADGRIEAYPLAYVTNYAESDGQLVIETNIEQNFTYSLADIDSVSEQAPTDFPSFLSYKFNNKYNDQLFTDAAGVIESDTVFVTIAAIGKRLTASFQVPDEETEVYVGGERQISKESRLRFDKDIYYTLAHKGCTMLLPVADTKGEYAMQPYGRKVRVHVNWLTDRAEVPTIYINTSDGQPITSKDYYKDAEITIDGHDIFPSMATTAVQIKGRGNSSWGWAKKPYRLKFAEKVKPLGMTKGKSWVLLANGQTGSLMSNAIGMKAANLMGAAAANHIVPVDVYLNGEYRGSYNLTEKVGLSNNSVDIGDETRAALLELDSYYDEPEGQKFRSAPYDLPINVKEPDFSEGTTLLTLETISSSFNRFMSTLYRGQDISRFVDVEQLARFMMVNELTLNYEFYHPKSTFCYREDFENDSSKYIFGPVWDLDWCFGYERSRNYFVNESTSNYWIDMPSMEACDFIRDLRWKYEPLCALYEELWRKFMDEDLQELVEYCQDYYDFAKNSFASNSSKWGDYTNYAQQASTASSWLQVRAEQIYDDIVNDVRPDMPGPAGNVEFASDRLYNITCQRGALVLTEDHKGLTTEQERNYYYPDEDAQFAIISIEGNNYLYSPVTKQYLAYYGNGTWVSELGTPINFDDTHPNGIYTYMMSVMSETGSTLFFNHNSSILVINGYTSPDPGNRFLIEEVADFDPTEALKLASSSLMAVTNRYIFNGEVAGEETRMMPKGSVPPTPSKQWTNAYTTLREPDDIPYEITEPVTIDYEVEWFGPFIFTTAPGDEYWYNMTIRSDYFVAVQDSEPYYPVEATEDDLLLPEYSWAFGGNPYHVLVYNYATEFGKTLTAVGDYALMRSGEYGWDLIPCREGFVLRQPGTDASCINQFGGTSGPLKFWDDQASLTDNGSTFRIYESDITGISGTEVASRLQTERSRKVLRDGHIYILRGGKTYRTDGTEIAPNQ